MIKLHNIFSFNKPRETSYEVTLSIQSSLFRALTHLEVSKAQVPESGRTELRNFDLWIRCIANELNLE